MADLVRDAPIGQLIRYITGSKVLLYPEERPGSTCPACYAEPESAATAQAKQTTTPSSISGMQTGDPEKADVGPTGMAEREESAQYKRHALQPLDTPRSDLDLDLEKTPTNKSRQSQISRVSTRKALEQAHTRADLEAAFSAATQLEREPTRHIIPQRTSDGTILVDWYTTDDASNPQNWSLGKKAFVSLSICLYTLAVYMGSSIYTSSAQGVMKEFHVSTEAASLGLSLYVLAYGMGPLVWSPLSEIPSIGRNPPYIITMGIFVILCVPAALAPNFAGLLVLRFLQGFFGSPCLATGAASLQDMVSLIKLPYILCIWALAACGGPALGPVISGFSVTADNWRWSLWEMLWFSGPVFLMMLLFLPETSSSNILLRRAQRLRKLTGDRRLKAQSEIDQAEMRPKDIVYEALIRPMQLMFMDPAIAFTAVYVGLCYGIYYSFFEAFPLVYIDKYHFNLGEMGLTFLAILVGAVLSICLYYSYIYYVMEPDFRAHGLGAPERRLIPALAASFLLPIGLFIFAWTGDKSSHVHWFGSVIGSGVFIVGVFVLMQCIFVYLPLVYPQYAASLFAGNDFARSSVAFAAVMFSRPMYIRLGIGWGTSLLAFLTAGCVGGIFVLFLFGDKLRARSRFSAK